MHKRTITAMVLALAVPGLGHFFLGRRERAAIFFVVVIFLFLAGIGLEGRLYTPEPGGLLSLLATVGSMGVGLPYFLARAAGAHGNVSSITFEYGTAFMLTAGLMNLLLVLDAFDISERNKA